MYTFRAFYLSRDCCVQHMKKFLSYIFWPIVAGALFAVALLSVPFLAKTYPDLLPGLAPAAEEAPPPAPSMLSFSEAIRKAAPAVVSINLSQEVFTPVEEYQTSNPNVSLYRGFFDDGKTLGSGVIISPDGYIITSHHIFDQPGIPRDFEHIVITLADGRNLEARIVAYDAQSDLALLRVDTESLRYIDIGPSRNLEVGEVVLAIGNPRNIGQSVSLGIISALLNRDDDFVIQTDAAINPGNSGGALIDINGNLIGINSTIVSESGGSEGIGFATPADRAFNLMDAYIASGPSGYLGVSTELVRVQAVNTIVQGFKVKDMNTNGPADKAGIKSGDIITGVNGIPVDFDTLGLNFVQAISAHDPGDTVTLEIFRGSEFIQLNAELAVGEPRAMLIPDQGQGRASQNEEQAPQIN